MSYVEPLMTVPDKPILPRLCISQNRVGSYLYDLKHFKTFVVLIHRKERAIQLVTGDMQRFTKNENTLGLFAFI